MGLVCHRRRSTIVATSIGSRISTLCVSPAAIAFTRTPLRGKSAVSLSSLPAKSITLNGFSIGRSLLLRNHTLYLGPVFFVLVTGIDKTHGQQLQVILSGLNHGPLHLDPCAALDHWQRDPNRRLPINPIIVWIVNDRSAPDWPGDPKSDGNDSSTTTLPKDSNADTSMRPRKIPARNKRI